jgi:hypothetical protein
MHTGTKQQRFAQEKNMCRYGPNIDEITKPVRNEPR